MQHPTDLPPAITSERKSVELGAAGRVGYYLDQSGEGTPLLLLHSINAAPSAMEMRPLFQRYRSSRPVYAPDLPGFGGSDRSDRDYSSDLYSSAIVAFIDEVIGEPVDAVALSLTSEFVAAAALKRPTLFRSISLISPTGFGNQSMPGGSTARWIKRLLDAPLLGSGLWRLLTSRRSIRYFLGKSFSGEPDQEMMEYAYVTAHQPGAHHAPFQFVTGGLFHPQATAELYQPLELPVLVLYDWDPNISFEQLPALAAENSDWRVVRMPGTCGLPHWDQTRKTAINLDSFWLSIPAKAADIRQSSRH